MTPGTKWSAIALAAALAACGETKDPAPAEPPAGVPAPEVAAPPVPDAPRADAEPVAPPKPGPLRPAVARETVDRNGKDWSKHMGDLPFVFGTEAGVAKAKETGRPLMLFYTATW